MLDEHSEAYSQILEHFILQLWGLQRERIPERAGAAPHYVKFVTPVEPVPVSEQRFAVLQLGFPLRSPIDAERLRR